MTDKILLNDMEFLGHHGCSEEERQHSQPFIVDAELYIDLSKSGNSDNIDDTVDYVRVFKEVEKIVTGQPKNLIEAVAEDIANALLEKFSLIDSVKLTIRKPKPPVVLSFAGAAVSIFRSRNP